MKGLLCLSSNRLMEGDQDDDKCQQTALYDSSTSSDTNKQTADRHDPIYHRARLTALALALRKKKEAVIVWYLWCISKRNEPVSYGDEEM